MRRARRRWPTWMRPSIWCCSGCPTTALVGAAGGGRGDRARGRRCCSGPRTGCARRSPRSRPMQGWRCAARAAWASSTTRCGVRALGYLEPDPLPSGGISLITHSGSAFSTLLRARRGFGFRLAVSSGQELVTDTADYVDYALDDPDTRIIALLMETPRAVPAAAAGAAARRRPGRAGGDPDRRRITARQGHGGRTLGCARRRSAPHGTRSARPPAPCTSATWPSSPTRSNCSRRQGDPAAAASRRCTIRAPNARWSPTSPTTWVSSSPIWPTTRWPRSARCSTTD